MGLKVEATSKLDGIAECHHTCPRVLPNIMGSTASPGMVTSEETMQHCKQSNHSLQQGPNYNSLITNMTSKSSKPILGRHAYCSMNRPDMSMSGDLNMMRYRGVALLLSLKDGNACWLHAPLRHTDAAIADPALHVIHVSA